MRRKNQKLHSQINNYITPKLLRNLKDQKKKKNRQTKTPKISLPSSADLPPKIEL